MSFDYGSFDTALKAAVGEDAALMAELRLSFVDSAKRQVSLLSRSRCDANWQYSSWRLRGLAAGTANICLRMMAPLKVLKMAPREGIEPSASSWTGRHSGR